MVASLGHIVRIGKATHPGPTCWHGCHCSWFWRGRCHLIYYERRHQRLSSLNKRRPWKLVCKQLQSSNERLVRKLSRRKYKGRSPRSPTPLSEEQGNGIGAEVQTETRTDKLTYRDVGIQTEVCEKPFFAKGLQLQYVVGNQSRDYSRFVVAHLKGEHVCPAATCGTSDCQRWSHAHVTRV